MSEAITITLPLPERGLSPNARTHWAGLHRLRRQAKERAQLLTLQAMTEAGSLGTPWRSATVKVRWYDKQDYGRDRDNALASLKAYIDGTALAGLVDDDRYYTFEPVDIEIDKANPRVELEIRRDAA